MPKTTPMLWFDDQAEEAVDFYLSVLPNARVLDVSRYAEVGLGPVGSVMTIRFELDALLSPTPQHHRAEFHGRIGGASEP